MKGQWKEVVKLAFKGQRFEGHALDSDAFDELRQFQKIVTETAKALWRAANPSRERLPSQFDDRTRFGLRRIEPGSAVAPLEVFIEEPELKGLSELEPTEVNEAIALVHRVYRAVEDNDPLPEEFPRSLVPEYQRWGQGLGKDDVIEVILAGKEPVRVTSSSRCRLASFVEDSHEDRVDILGEVFEADVRQGRFQMWRDENISVTVSFSPEQEDEVTGALREHKTLRLQVSGRGEFSPQGKLLRIATVEKLQLRPLGDVSYDASARPIEDELAELADGIPAEDWKRLPADLSDNLDHYLYGTPRQ